jgi:hypothetical protein
MNAVQSINRGFNTPLLMCQINRGGNNIPKHTTNYKSVKNLGWN